MLRERILSAVVLLPVVVACTWLGGAWFCAMVLIALVLGAREFAAMGSRAGHRVWSWGSMAIAGALALEQWLWHGRLQALVLALALIAVTVWYVVHHQAATRTEAWAITIAAGIYVGFLGCHFIALRMLESGIGWLALAVVTMWVSDTGAYGAGRALGKHKMAPSLSPKKTWEGAAGGLATALGAAVLIAHLADIAPIHGVATGLLIGLVCPLGDLAISMVKRQVGVKDTGSLIPGHGGVLDRLDTLLFSAPLVYYYAVLVAKAVAAGG